VQQRSALSQQETGTKEVTELTNKRRNARLNEWMVMGHLQEKRSSTHSYIIEQMLALSRVRRTIKAMGPNQKKFDPAAAGAPT
jgi:hypothetical protein